MVWTKQMAHLTRLSPFMIRQPPLAHQPQPCCVGLPWPGAQEKAETLSGAGVVHPSVNLASPGWHLARGRQSGWQVVPKASRGPAAPKAEPSSAWLSYCKNYSPGLSKFLKEGCWWKCPTLPSGAAVPGRAAASRKSRSAPGDPLGRQVRRAGRRGMDALKRRWNQWVSDEGPFRWRTKLANRMFSILTFTHNFFLKKNV